MDFRNVKGYNELTKEQQVLLERVYQRHMAAMGTDTKKQYVIENIKEVEWDQKEKTVNIHFEDIWWHYSGDDTWF